MDLKEFLVIFYLRVTEYNINLYCFEIKFFKKE